MSDLKLNAHEARAEILRGSDASKLIDISADSAEQFHHLVAIAKERGARTTQEIVNAFLAGHRQHPGQGVLL